MHSESKKPQIANRLFLDVPLYLSVSLLCQPQCLSCKQAMSCDAGERSAFVCAFGRSLTWSAMRWCSSARATTSCAYLTTSANAQKYPAC